MAALSKTTRLSLVATLLVVAGFLSLTTLQGLTTAQLQGTGMSTWILAGTAGSFQRYAISLIVSAISLCLLVLFDRKRADANPTTDARNQILTYAVLAFFLCYQVMTRCLQFHFSVDDAYIDYRYVENWVYGRGFDYNPSERVMGFTSHVHLAVLTVLFFLFRGCDISFLSQEVNVIFGIASFFLVFLFLRRTSDKPLLPILGAAIYALFPFNTQETIGGKETLIAQFLMLLSLYAMQCSKPNMLAWSSALVALTRPEGIIWLVSTLAWAVKTKTSSLVKTWAPPFAALAAYGAWLMVTFGTLIPHGMIGKSTMFFKPFPMMDMVLLLRRIADGAFVPEFTAPIPQPFSDGLDYCRLYGGTVLILAGLKFIKPKVIRFYLFTVIAYFLMYSIVNPYLFPWYYCWFSLVPPLLIPCFVTDLMDYVHNAKRASDKVIGKVIISFLLLVQVIQQPIRIDLFGLPTVCFFWSGAFQRLLGYKVAAEFVTNDPLNKEHKGVMAVSELGVLGKYYPGPMLDLGGLVSHSVLKYPPPKELQRSFSLFTINPEIIKVMKPAYLVSDGSFCEKGIDEAPFFKDEYEIATIYPIKLWSEGIYVYRRKDLKDTTNNKSGQQDQLEKTK